MTRRRTRRRNWTQEETDLLKHFVLTYGTTRGAIEAQKELDATLTQIKVKIHNMQSTGIIKVPRMCRTKDPETLAILRRYISEYPNNLQKAFKLTAEDTGLSARTIEWNWYTKKSPLYKDNIGPCFMLVAKTKVAVNSKNCTRERMMERSRKAIKRFIIKAFGITRADLRS